MPVRMTATKGFTNPRIVGPRPDGAVLPGDDFSTDWAHGQELRRLNLAEPVDEGAFDREPVDAMAPHNQISEPELRRINARRQTRAARETGPAVAGAPLSRAFAAPESTPRVEADPAPGAAAAASAAPPAPTIMPAPAPAAKSNVPPIPPAPEAPKP